MIEACGLTKRYGRVAAVDNLSFRVAPGRVTGFLGQNGSGKSITMRLMGMDRPDSGRATIGGGSYRDLRWPLPEVGAGPDGIRWIRSLVRSLAAQGRSVLLSSHLISELAQTAEHLVVIAHGRLLADTGRAELTSGGQSL
jgi:ABC-2 type transport system ATP-binding protein